MPTGYTSEVANGQTFEDFVLGCARAFGACITLRDEPQNSDIPEFELNTYHIDRLAEYTKELKEVLELTSEELNTRAQNQFNSELENYYERVDENNSTQDNYTAMINNVEEWGPPTEDHKELKKFMLKQLKDSKELDDYIPDMPVRKTGEQWLADKVKSISWYIEYHTKENTKEIERVASRNKWVKQLKESI